MLLCAGVVTLVFQPVPASASELAKTPADFTIHAGETIEKTFSKPMIGANGEGYGTAECRNDPVFKLTCATNRIKIAQRTPGYFLRITTSWLGQSTPAEAIPDIDTYLYDTAEGHLATSDVGGATSSDVPEMIKLVNPTQDEYDLVVVDFLGPVTEYTVSVQYTNQAAGPSPAPADLLLVPHQPPTVKNVSKPLVGYTGDPALYPAVLFPPDACRDDPTRDLVCDVFRIKLNRNASKDASNFVVLTLDWDVLLETPALPVALVGVGEAQIPHLVMFLYDSAAHVMDRVAVGGQESTAPQRLAFTASQDEYDLVIQASLGAVTSYKLTAFMTDQIFGKPFELLDPITGQPISTAPSSGADFDQFLPPAPGLPPLGLAPIDIDDQIAGIGLDTTQEFDVDEAIRLGQEALRNTAVTSDPPSGAVLLLVMLVIPFGLMAGGVVVMRRRHNVLI